jgi:hypothetical protein
MGQEAAGPHVDPGNRDRRFRIAFPGRTLAGGDVERGIGPAPEWPHRIDAAQPVLQHGTRMAQAHTFDGGKTTGELRRRLEAGGQRIPAFLRPFGDVFGNRQQLRRRGGDVEVAAMGAAHAAGNLLARRVGRNGLVKLTVTGGNQSAQPFPRRLGDQRAEPRSLPRDLVGGGRIGGSGFGWFHGAAAMRDKANEVDQPLKNVYLNANPSQRSPKTNWSNICTK